MSPGINPQVAGGAAGSLSKEANPYLNPGEGEFSC